MKPLFPFLTLLCCCAGVAMLATCASVNNRSVIYADDYNASKDETSVMILPYGRIGIPGRWTNTKYSQTSEQYFFQGPDSATFAVSLRPCDSFSFYQVGMSPWTFVNDFYEWDSNHLRQLHHGDVRILKADEQRNFIIWNIRKAPGLDAYFLFGLKNATAYNLSVYASTWNEAKTVVMLENVYLE